ncbi:hypothetical protein BLA29_007426, partial [Euroglyphus maynei]
PVIIEVPHFASLRGKERDIVIFRSDNGETWREHTLEATEEAVLEVLNARPEGGILSSTVVPQVQAIFPEGALTKKIKVGLQVGNNDNDDDNDNDIGNVKAKKLLLLKKRSLWNPFRWFSKGFCHCRNHSSKLKQQQDKVISNNDVRDNLSIQNNDDQINANTISKNDKIAVEGQSSINIDDDQKQKSDINNNVEKSNTAKIHEILTNDQHHTTTTTLPLNITTVRSALEDSNSILTTLENQTDDTIKHQHQVKRDSKVELW